MLKTLTQTELNNIFGIIFLGCIDITAYTGISAEKLSDEIIKVLLNS